MTASSHNTPRVRSLLVWLIISLGLLACTLLDSWVFLTCTIDPERKLFGAEWYQVLRQAGNVLPWAIVACALILHDLRLQRTKLAVGELTHELLTRARSAFLHRGSMVLLAAVLGGAAAEILKLVTQRGRPIGLGVYRFGFFEDVAAKGLASSHAGVAFGAAFMLGKLFPGSFWPLFVLACGTSVTRITPGAHYLSDLYVGAVCSWLVVGLLWRMLGSAPGGHAHRVSFLSPIARTAA